MDNVHETKAVIAFHNLLIHPFILLIINIDILMYINNILLMLFDFD